LIAAHGTITRTVLTPKASIWSKCASMSAGVALYKSESAIPTVVDSSLITAVSTMLKLAALTGLGFGRGDVGTSKFATYAHKMAIGATAITVKIA
jgi:hypothetical protein